MKDILVEKADKLAHFIYQITKDFPKSEIFGITSQIRRSSLSVALNLIEGYARNRSTEYIHYLEIAYGSLKETKYLLHFSYKEGYYKESVYKDIINLSEEIGKMIWSRMQKMKLKIK